MNKVILIGNICSDLELKKTKTDKSVCSFRLATNEYGKSQFHNIVVWEKQAENAAKYLSKGSSVAVDGTISYRDYEDRDGNKRYVTEIVGNLKYIGKKSNNNAVSDDW